MPRVQPSTLELDLFERGIVALEGIQARLDNASPASLPLSTAVETINLRNAPDPTPSPTSQGRAEIAKLLSNARTARDREIRLEKAAADAGVQSQVTQTPPGRRTRSGTGPAATRLSKKKNAMTPSQRLGPRGGRSAATTPVKPQAGQKRPSRGRLAPEPPPKLSKAAATLLARAKQSARGKGNNGDSDDAEDTGDREWSGGEYDE
ncbi:hypothetical protein UVI_02030470 [Ustilaginoidea virens]|uniref:Uncharacterized protein n=1 Tax=Ustilaginoidea virens TaxID=1159556 RepID=A0A1B5LA40_USTVR|nr:hypothetical protein UVI_02030470 [Ustilaginoidea virens]